MRPMIAEMQLADPVLASGLSLGKGRIAGSWEGTSVGGIGEPRRKMRGTIEDTVLRSRCHGVARLRVRCSASEVVCRRYVSQLLLRRANSCHARREPTCTGSASRFSVRFSLRSSCPSVPVHGRVNGRQIIELPTLLTLRDGIQTAPVPRFTTYLPARRSLPTESAVEFQLFIVRENATSRHP